MKTAITILMLSAIWLKIHGFKMKKENGSISLRQEKCSPTQQHQLAIMSMSTVNGLNKSGYPQILLITDSVTIRFTLYLHNGVGTTLQ